MEEPTEDDCCHSDCLNCVFDVYQKQKTSRDPVRGSGSSALSTTRYKPFRLVRIDSDSLDVNVYSFRSDEGGQLHCRPGEHVVLRNEPSPSEPAVSRQYTVLSTDDPSTFSVLIKLYPEGQMSRYVRRWAVGHVSHWRGPYGQFTYQPNTYRKLLMLCVGTGIAPVFEVAKYIVNNEKDESKIVLLYGSRSSADIALRSDIARLSNYWNFKCVHFLSRETGQKKFGETFVAGRLTAEAAHQHLDIPYEDCLILICGSAEFSTTIRDSLISYGLPPTSLFTF